MPLLSVLFVIIVFGVLLWVVNTYIPMDPKVKNVLNVVAIVFLILWLVNLLGLLAPLESIRVGR